MESVNGKLQKKSCFGKLLLHIFLLVLTFFFALWLKQTSPCPSLKLYPAGMFCILAEEETRTICFWINSSFIISDSIIRYWYCLGQAEICDLAFEEINFPFHHLCCKHKLILGRRGKKSYLDLSLNAMYSLPKDEYLEFRKRKKQWVVYLGSLLVLLDELYF